MSLTENVLDILKNYFLTDLLAAKKKCNNIINEFNNTKKCVIDFVNEQIIKNNKKISQIYLNS